MRQLRTLVLIASLLVLLGAAKAQTDYISTYAGGGPNNVLATSANLNGPTYVAVDSSGNYYFSVPNQARVFKVTVSTGILTVVAGNGFYGFSGDGGLATKAQLNNPAGLAFDSSGNVYIADVNNCVVRKVDHTTLKIGTFAGTAGSCGYSGNLGPPTAAQLNYPAGLAVVGSTVYIADTNNCVVRKVASNVITTFAGTNICSYSGDTGLATAAQLNHVNGLGVDSAGNLYMADRDNYRIRKVTLSTLKISTVAGNGTYGYTGDTGLATSAEITNAYGIAVDAAGNIFIDDGNNYRIREVTVADGKINTVAGNGSYGSAGDGGLPTAAYITNVYGVGVNSLGNLFLADYNNLRIRKVVLASTINTVAGNGLPDFTGNNVPVAGTVLKTPTDATSDASGNIFLADLNNNVVLKALATTGIASIFVGTPDVANATLNTPRRIAVNSAGDVFIADNANCNVVQVPHTTGLPQRFAGTNVCGFFGDGGPATSAQLNAPSGVAVNAAGIVYIADTNNHRMRKVSGGTITTIAGTGTCGYSGDLGAATAAMLCYPNDVAIDPSSLASGGNLYIADTNNFRVRVINKSGTIDTFAGNGSAGFGTDNVPADETSLYYPTGVAVDLAGDVLIADQSNQRIRWVGGDGIIHTVAGSGAYGYSGDGGPAPSAALANPYGVGVAPNGNIYVADTANYLVRKVNAVAALNASPKSLTFGTELVGTMSNEQTTTLAAIGPLTVSNIATTGDFLETDDCPIGAMASSSTCTAWLYFAPTALGTRTGTLTFTDNGFYSTTTTVNLTGIGTAITVTPPFLAFGGVLHGTSLTKNVIVKNNLASGSITMGVISLTGDASYTIFSNTCTGSLGAGLTCTITIKFAPTTTGAKKGELIIKDNDPTSPQLVGVTGTGT